MRDKKKGRILAHFWWVSVGEVLWFVVDKYVFSQRERDREREREIERERDRERPGCASQTWLLSNVTCPPCCLPAPCTASVCVKTKPITTHFHLVAYQRHVRHLCVCGRVCVCVCVCVRASMCVRVHMRPNLQAIKKESYYELWQKKHAITSYKENKVLWMWQCPTSFVRYLPVTCTAHLSISLSLSLSLCLRACVCVCV